MRKQKDGNSPTPAAERWLKRLMWLCLVILLCSVAAIYLRRDRTTPEQPEIVEPDDDTLTETLFRYPKNVTLDETLPVETFEDESGKVVSLQRYRGSYVVLTYWASWCEHCSEQLRLLPELTAAAEAYGDVEYVLINKLDGEKETLAQAQDYLTQNNISVTSLYDDGLTAYDAMGLQIVPTTLILDKSGKLVYCHAGVIQSADELKAMLDYAHDGRAAATETFVKTYMMNEDGGMYTGYTDGSGLAVGHDVLSESQGLLMEYAALTENQPLFVKTYNYVRNFMMTYALPVWVTEDEQTISVNALLDDLRILKALGTMQERYGGYQDRRETLAEALVLYCTKNQKPVDFYDFLYEQQATQFTLCYGDLAAIRQLAVITPVEPDLEANTLALIEGGYISDEFPLYHNNYDYVTFSYDSGAINMVEGLYTLYHLAEVGQLKDTSLEWLRTQMNGNGIFARYETSGEVSVGYEYESASVYALVGLIANEVGDQQLLTQAVARMEQFRVFDTSSAANGAFGNGTLEDTASYDQCMALLLYAKMAQ